MCLQPPNLLIEVQGEQHTSKADCRQHNQGDTVGTRQHKDHVLADAAIAAGFSVLWLYPGDECGRHSRWAAALQMALEHVTANQAPKLLNYSPTR